jgi:hypothetical protein
MLAGFLTTTAANPLDVVKTRMFVDEPITRHRPAAMQVIAHIYKTEGCVHCVNMFQFQHVPLPFNLSQFACMNGNFREHQKRWVSECATPATSTSIKLARIWAG